MRDAIVQRSIESLLKNGLRFSIDEVAKSLGISKKTIYKYFPAKEELAIEIYKTYYENARRTIAEIKDLHSKETVERTLSVYYRSHCMNRSEIFNKYALNENIRALARRNHGDIKMHVENLLPAADRAALMIIIDGTLQNLCKNADEETVVIERLASLLC